LLHGNLLTALHDNALYVVSIPLLLLLWVRWFAESGTRSARPGRRWLVVAIVVAVLFSIVRNLPFGEFLSPA
jgi:hypothetical protein